MAEELIILLPGLLGIGVIIAAIITKNNKYKTDNEVVMNEDSLKAIQEAAKEGVREVLKDIQVPPPVAELITPPTPVAKEPFDMEKVYPANQGQGDESGSISQPMGLTGRVWQLLPSLVVLGVMVYFSGGYVKVSNYAADSKGLNDRISMTENTSLPQINTSLAGLTEQINVINADLATIRLKEQTFATSNSVADVNSNIGKLQSDLKNVSGNLQALQVSVVLLQKTQNTTNNVTSNVTK